MKVQISTFVLNCNLVHVFMYYVHFKLFIGKFIPFSINSVNGTIFLNLLQILSFNTEIAVHVKITIFCWSAFLILFSFSMLVDFPYQPFHVYVSTKQIIISCYYDLYVPQRLLYVNLSNQMSQKNTFLNFTLATVWAVKVVSE